METILLAGGKGLIGQHLCEKLAGLGYRVTLLSRTAQPDAKLPVYVWDVLRNTMEREAVEKADYIINLAGANIGKGRWTKKRRKEILESRVFSGDLIYRTLSESFHNCKAYISASATGYYGIHTSDKIFVETDPPSGDFLGETCRQWEESADQFRTLGIRTVRIRAGMVLTQYGGALGKMKIPVMAGLGSALGTGRQYMPWIHIDDLCDIYIRAIRDPRMNGAYNAVAPGHQTNRDFTREMARVLHKAFWFPGIPSLVLNMFFGKMASILLYGSRVSPDKILGTGYRFRFPDLNSALKDLLLGK